MKTISASLREHLNKNVTALATCWEITRRDGTVYRFTDCDEDVLVEGQNYLAIGAYSRTAIESTASLAVDNLDIQGIVSEITLPASELRAGAFDFAEVKVFLTPWMQAYPGVLKMRRGFFGEIAVMPNGTFKAELRGLMQRFSHEFTSVYTANCLNDLGDRNCRVPLYGNLLEDGVFAKVHDTFTYLDSSKPIGPREELAIEDKDFEDLHLNGFSLARYWFDPNDIGANEMTGTTDPWTGSTYAQGSAAGAHVAQDIEIIRGHVTAAAVDAGDAYLDFTFFRSDLSPSNGRVRVLFMGYDRNDAPPLGIWTAGYMNAGAGWATEGVRNYNIPTGTRIIRVVFDAPSASSRFSHPHGFITIDQPSGGEHHNAFSIASNVLVAKTHETVSHVLGGFIRTPLPAADADGLISLGDSRFSVQPGRFHAAQITRVEDTRTFRVLFPGGGDPELVNAFFELGTIQVMNGKNRLTGMEIKSYTRLSDSEGIVELYLSLPYPLTIGDSMILIPGCDKSRICCVAMWNNIENFFGVPDVPGEDSTFEYPDQK